MRERVRGFAASDYVHTDTVYDGRARVAQASAPYHAGEPIRWNTPAYDVLNRPTGLAAADATQSQSTVYDGFALAVTDAAGTVRQRRRSALGQVIESREDAPSGVGFLALTAFAYDVAGHLTRIVKRDASGAAITETVTTHQYDRLGRARSRAEPNSDNSATVTTTWSYDDTSGGNAGVGRLTGGSLPGFSRSFVYDPAAGGRLRQSTTTVGPETFTVSLAYDALGRLERLTYPQSPSYTADGCGVLGGGR